MFKGKIIEWILDEENLNKLYNKFNIKYILQLKEKLVSQDPLDRMYKYEIYILSDILNYKISVLNQYDEKIFEYNTNSSNVITIKYDLYNDIINKYYVIYTIN